MFSLQVIPKPRTLAELNTQPLPTLRIVYWYLRFFLCMAFFFEQPEVTEMIDQFSNDIKLPILLSGQFSK